MRALLLMLAACGSAPALVAAPLPPNVDQACDRAIRCQIFSSTERAQCVQCLNHIDPVVLAQLRRDYGDLPPLDQVDCDTLAAVCNDETNIGLCVADPKHWRWPA